MPTESEILLVKISDELKIEEEITIALLNLLKTDCEKMAMVIALTEMRINNRREVLAVARQIMKMYEKNPQALMAQIETQ